MGSYCFIGTEFLFEMMRKFWKWIVVMVAHYSNVRNATELYILKWVK